MQPASSTGAWPNAYNSVAARTTLARPQSPPVSDRVPFSLSALLTSFLPQTASTAAKVKWPPAVRYYAGRAFDVENNMPDISQEEIVVKLREIVTFYAERSSLDVVDWSTYPLPQALIRLERAERARAQAQAQPSNPSLNNPTSYSSTNPAHHPSPSPHSKKRKSQDRSDSSEATAASVPPWERTNLEYRITRDNTRPNEKRQKKHALSGDAYSKSDQADLEKRKQRFQLDKSSRSTKTLSPDADAAARNAPCIGTNTNLEKSYFRLTAPPKPENVRPQHVLEQTLDMLRKKWKAEKNYGYICNQLKSLRQDITVQHIKNAFTVKVYESHAKIALQQGDMGEYNQCQTKLKALYAENLAGNPDEFTAYRVLYFVYTCNTSDMNALLAELTPADKTKPEIKHALEVRSSLAVGNYHKFFRLYSDAPNLGGYLMNMFIERERLQALANISRA